MSEGARLALVIMARIMWSVGVCLIDAPEAGMGFKVGNMDGVPHVDGTWATESDVGDVRKGGAGHMFYIALDEHAHEVCVHLAAAVAGGERRDAGRAS